MSFTVAEIADWAGGKVVNGDLLGAKLDQIRIHAPAELAHSTASDVAFFFSKSYQNDLTRAAPGVLITGELFVQPLRQSGLPLWERTAIIACADPYLGMAQVLEKIAAQQSSMAHLQPGPRETQIHPSACVHSTAEIGAGVTIGPNCVIEEGVKIGEGTRLYPGCYLGVRSTVGKNCVLFPRVTLYEWTQVGDRVRLHAGVVLGADGFGYAQKREGTKVVGHQKIHHLGRVTVGDDVEIGANTCIDRATIGETRVERNAKIDDLVMIGHNCVIEEGAIVCGKTGLSGRARIGKYAIVLGAAGLANDVHVGDGALVAAHTLVSKDVPPGMTVVGNPQREQREHFKIQALMNRMLTQGKRRGSKSEKGEK